MTNWRKAFEYDRIPLENDYKLHPSGSAKIDAKGGSPAGSTIKPALGSVRHKRVA